jgi:TonB-linked SusC/RagA family outer membrane protein
VTQANGEGLPGVTVLVKGTSIGTSTGADGSFSLSVPEGSVLVFSSVGFGRQEVPVTGAAANLAIVLKDDQQALNEVVVVGYGTQSRQTVTTAITSVNAAAIERQPVAGFDQALQGQAPGVQVTAPSGAPGAGINVRIRGNATIGLNASPLYVIDGIPVLPAYDQELSVGGQRPNPLNAINPNDIESIDVLKDGAAAAIYGLRASNGVVVITTKRGKVGKATVGFSTYFGRQVIRKKLDLLNGQQFAQLYNEEQVNRGLSPAFNPDTVRTNTNWQDEVYRPANIQNYQLNVSGGTDKTRYYLAGGYFKQDGISLNSGFDRYTFKLNLDQQLGSRFRAGTSLNLSRTNNNNSTRSENGAGSSGTVLGALASIPTMPVRAADGTYSVNPFGRNFDNPIGNLLESSNKAVIYQVIGNVYGELDVLKNLTLRSTAGIDFRTQLENEFISRDYPGTSAPTTAEADKGSARTGTNQQVIWLQENTLTYRPSLGERHNLTLLAGESMQVSDRFTSSAGGKGYASNAVPYLNAATVFFKPSSYQDQWGLLSFFGRATYDYDQRYLLSLSLRADGSSRFRDGRKFGYFPAASAGWRVSRESFFPQNKVVSDLKLRGSFGANGNQEFYTYERFSRYGVGYTYPGTSVVAAGTTQSDIGNNDLKWETTYQYNAGLDLGLLDNRLTFTADVYRKHTKDLLLRVQIPLSTGAENRQILQNVGSIQNQGLELGLTTANVQPINGFGWTTNFNFTMNRNKVLDLGQSVDDKGKVVDRRIESGNGFVLKGQPLGVFYGYQVQGLFQSQAEVDAAAKQSPGNTAPGDIRFRDLNGDGIINPDDRTIIGNPNPKSIAGVTNTFTFKGLELSVFFQGSFGNDIYNQNRETLESMSSPLNQTTRVLSRWTPTNRNTDVPRAIAGDPNGNARYSDRFIEDGSYVRLKNLTLAYNLPTDLIRHAALSNLRLYVTGQNLVTWTHYSGYDPEVSSDPFSTTGQGRDFGVYPQSRTYTVGLNASF